MVRSRAGIFLSLLALALCLAVGLWIFHLQRESRERAAREAADAARASAVARDAGAAAAPADDGAAHDDADAMAREREADSPAGSDLPVSIEGKVTDESGAGVAGARVVAIERRALSEAIAKDAKRLDREPLEALRAFRRSLRDLASRLPSCLTAADGTYALRGLPAGEHRVAVRHDDFLPYADEGWLLVETGRKVRCDVELVRGQEISGVVRDARGDPVAGARVRASPVETARLKGLGQVVQVFVDEVEGASLLEADPVGTDRQGAFRIASLAPGLYDLRAVKDGHAWGEARGVGAGSRDVEIALEAAAAVSGRIVSARGDPVASASVALREPDRDIQGPDGPMAVAFVDLDLFREKERGGASDAEGRFALAAFARGAYELVVRADGFPELRRPVSVDGAALDLGDVALAEAREIAGAVLSPDGGPVAGAAVWIPKPPARREDRDSRRTSVLDAGPSWSVARTQTDGRGVFRLAGLGEASCELAVLADGFAGEVLDRVAADGRKVTVVLKRGLTIRGRVVGAEDGGAIAGAKVAAENGPSREAVAGDDGRFELRGATLPGGAAGSVTVRASLEGFHEARAAAAFPDPAASPLAEVEIALRRLAPQESQGEVSGIVHDAAGAPIAGARVWAEVPGFPRAFLLMMAPDKTKEARTDAGGSFAIRAPRFGGKDFEVVASFPGLATSRRGPFPAEGNGPDGGVWPAIDIELGEGAALEGRVTGPAGEPVSGARIRIRREARGTEEATLFTRLLPQAAGETTYSGTDGRYRLRRIEPGSWRVEALAPGYAAKTIGPVEIGAAGAAASAPGATTLDIALEKGGSISGRVVDVRGEPLAGVEVSAFPVVAGAAARDEDEEEAMRTGALGAASAATRADGSYEIDQLPAGEFRVVARARGFEPASVPSASPGDTLPDIVLEAHARIAGRARDAATGAPLASFEVKLERRAADGSFHEDRRKSREVVDAAGRFAGDGLRAGEWRVRVLAAEHQAWEKELALEPGDEIELDATLSQGCRIAGVVRRPDGAPIAGADVTARRDGERHARASARSGDDGAFVLAGLDAGAYEATASQHEYFAEAGEGSAKVLVLDGADASVALVLRPAGKVFGRIRGLSFDPPNTHMWIVTFGPVAPPAQDPAAARAGGAADAKGAAQPFWLWADENGSFTRENVRPGKYRLELHHKRNTPETGGQWVDLPEEDRPLGEVEVRAYESVTFSADAR